MNLKTEKKVRATYDEVRLHALQKLLQIVDVFGDKALNEFSVQHGKFVADLLTIPIGPVPEKPEKKPRPAASDSAEAQPAQPSQWVKDLEKLLRESTEAPEANCNSSQVK